MQKLLVYRSSAGSGKTYTLVKTYLSLLFKIKSSPPKFIHDLLKFFGDISYSIYLLHPIVYTITGIIFYQINSKTNINILL